MSDERKHEQKCSNCGETRNPHDFYHGAYGSYGTYFKNSKGREEKVPEGCEHWCIKCIEEKLEQSTSKCSKCQSKLCDRSGKRFTWYTNEKYGNVCENCLEKLDEQGHLWDNFFLIRSYTYNPNHSDPCLESGKTCGFCHKGMLDRQVHKEENGRLTIKHDCQPTCIRRWDHKDGKDKKFRLTQEYLDYFARKIEEGDWNYKPRLWDEAKKCFDCEIKDLQRTIKENWSANAENGNCKKWLKEVKKLAGIQDTERERERVETNLPKPKSSFIVRTVIGRRI